MKIRCNNCMTVYEETEDNQIVWCDKCKSDKYLMTEFIPYNNNKLKVVYDQCEECGADVIWCEECSTYHHEANYQIEHKERQQAEGR